MAVIKYDVEDVESGGGGVEIQPGLHPGTIASVTARAKKSDGTPVKDLEVIIDFGPEYARKWTYIGLPGTPNWDNVKWKFREFTDALGLPAKGGFDPAKLVGKPVMVKIKIRKDDPDATEIKNLFKPGSESVSDQQSSDLAAGTDATDYSGWTTQELAEEIEERKLTMPTGRITDAKLIAVLEESDVPQDTVGDHDAGADAAADDAENPASEAFYAEWSDQDLKDEIAEKGIAVAGRFGRAKAIEALCAAAGDDGTPDGEAAEAEPADEYDTFTDDELKEEIADRAKAGVDIKVEGRWTREKAIATLRADDGNEPF